MTSRRRWGAALSGGLLTGLLAASPAAGASSLLFERTLIAAANARCGLLDADAAAALAAGRAQARRDAGRAGASPAQIAAVESRARAQAGALACRSPELRAAAQKVREAHASYARLERITYPGEIADWRADRGSTARPRWRLAQTGAAGQTPVVFGLAGGEAGEALLAVADFPKGRTPYAARLVMRDVARSSGPYLDRRGLAAGAVLPLARRLPQASGLKSFTAAGRAPAAAALAPKARTPLAFRFPAEAGTALAGLDPREAVAVEFLFSDRTVRVYYEVGDFAAGRDFLRLAAR